MNYISPGTISIKPEICICQPYQNNNVKPIIGQLLNVTVENIFNDWGIEFSTDPIFQISYYYNEEKTGNGSVPPSLVPYFTVKNCKKNFIHNVFSIPTINYNALERTSYLYRPLNTVKAKIGGLNFSKVYLKSFEVFGVNIKGKSRGNGNIGNDDVYKGYLGFKPGNQSYTSLS